jgi:hypothetical protein
MAAGQVAVPFCCVRDYRCVVRRKKFFLAIIRNEIQLWLPHDAWSSRNGKYSYLSQRRGMPREGALSIKYCLMVEAF